VLARKTRGSIAAKGGAKIKKKENELIACGINSRGHVSEKKG